MMIRASAGTASQVDPECLAFPLRSRWLIVARLFTIAAGLLAITWGLAVFPSSWRMSLVQPVADEILAGEPFKTETLLPLMPTIERVERAANCDPAALRSAAVIRLYISERDALSSTLRALVPSPADIIRRSLTCTPTDSFLWLALFSAEKAQNGLRNDQFQSLRMSYQLGPHEGWIALKRNRVVVPILDQLPADLAAAAVNEFTELVDDGLYTDAADILLSAGLEVRDRLVLGLVRVRDRSLEQFAGVLHARGYDLPRTSGANQRRGTE